jgi:hypothetical protein
LRKDLGEQCSVAARRKEKAGETIWRFGAGLEVQK